ncbi:hypothetical protein GXP67_35250 [Rhodocytophaga rosea]|uniref:Phytanoyl-CoA dioxygenase family protein n=1 Tax=Rhodocytophaga rosea TaxID=2704465 RepID=A0A6C0GW85_9BACT|nr:phytanoyl-CoA dioxygenase family protein [Rhodocytophaga rosea]QHT71550.1 hypothetical protein GXP67_35250 [Rhodocytophaga rosea]
MAANPLSQIFSKEKLVDSTLLNKIGVQPFRIIMANLASQIRSKSEGNSLTDQINTLKEEGLLVISNFLPAEEFAKIKQEAMQLISDPANISRVIKDGPNSLKVFDLTDQLITKAPTLLNYFNNEKLLTLFGSTTKKGIKPENIVKWLEVLEQGEGNRHADTQTHMHSDTYYDTYKAWLYLEDITLNKAPFAYVKSTQKVNMARLRYDYKNSISERPSPSRRITEEEINQRALKETIVTCKANTLAMANTFGYHRRLEGESGNSRIALYTSVRFHPFKL